MVKEEVLGGKSLSSSAWHKLEAPWEDGLSVEELPLSVGLWACLWAFFLVRDPCTRSLAIPGQVVLVV